MTSPDDYQVGGTHYQDLGVQPWAAMETWMTHEQFVGFLRGCAIKRLARMGSKGDWLVDAKKARHELDKMIDAEERVRRSGATQRYNPDEMAPDTCVYLGDLAEDPRA